MSTKRLGIAEALREGIAEEMRRDPTVFCIGEDIGIPGGWGGAFTVTFGLEKEFAPRMINTPIAEAGLMGVALGAAMMGMRPIADVQYGDFLFCAMDQVANQVAKMRYMSGGKLTVPMVMRAPVGVTGRGAQHAQMMEPFFLPLPGIKLLVPATAYDAKGLLKAAVRDGNPVLIFEHKLLYGSKGPRSESGTIDASSDIPDGDYTVPIGKGIVRREGTDVTIVATLLMMHRAMEAAVMLERDGISVEVIDPRSLVPFDWELVKEFRRKDGAVRDRRGKPQARRAGSRDRGNARRGDAGLPRGPGEAHFCAEHAGAILPAHGEVLRARCEADRARGQGADGDFVNMRQSSPSLNCP